MKITVKPKKREASVAPEDLKIGELYSFAYKNDGTRVIGVVIGRAGQSNQFVPLRIEQGSVASQDKPCKPWPITGKFYGEFTRFSGRIILESKGE